MKHKLEQEQINHIQWECQQLLYRVTMYTDKREWRSLADCYSDDAVLFRPSDPSTAISGKDNIYKSFIERGPRETCHMLSNFVFISTSINEVEVESRVWLISGPSSGELPCKSDSKLLIGSFKDKLVRFDDGWLISSRNGSIEQKYDYA